MIIYVFIFIFVIVFRLYYIISKYIEMKYHLIYYGHYKYLELIVNSKKQLVHSKSQEEYIDFMKILKDLDDSSWKIVNAIQKDFKPVYIILLKKFFKPINYSDLYIDGSKALEFIPEEFPDQWKLFKMSELNGFYSGIIAMQLNSVSEIENLLLSFINLYRKDTIC